MDRWTLQNASEKCRQVACGLLPNMTQYAMSACPRQNCVSSRPAMGGCWRLGVECGHGIIVPDCDRSGRHHHRRWRVVHLARGAVFQEGEEKRLTMKPLRGHRLRLPAAREPTGNPCRAHCGQFVGNRQSGPVALAGLFRRRVQCANALPSPTFDALDRHRPTDSGRALAVLGLPQG
jgi:hypothetical protein